MITRGINISTLITLRRLCTVTIAVSSLLLLPSFATCQISLDRFLIGSGGLEFSNSDFQLSSSIGEAIIATSESNDLILTQGFQQSNFVVNNPLILELAANPAACLGANDGSISVVFISEEITPPLSYTWSTGDTTASIAQLEPGVYSLSVTGSNGLGVTNSIRVNVTDSIDCAPIFYTGITPNGDGFNDYWHIDNADYFQLREVEVFNRYGIRVWKTDNYVNSNSSFDGRHQNGNDLPDGTYFFVGNFDGSIYKGWIEITR